jgi:hypothetical protein
VPPTFRSVSSNSRTVILSEAKDLGIGCRARMEILRFAQDDGLATYAEDEKR